MTRTTLVTLAVAALALGACSVANPFAASGTSANQSAQELALKWAQCMRQHGVNIPDPNGNGFFVRNGTAPSAGGSPSSGNTSAPVGIDPGSPQFQAAQNACKKYQPQGARAGGPPSQQQIDDLTRFAQCMRQHGIPMSDPQVSSDGRVSITASAPPSSASVNSDQFQQAQQACQHNLPGGAPPKAGGAGTGGQRNGS